MIELKLYNVSRMGNMFGDYFLFMDETFQEDFGIDDFVLKLTVREAQIIKRDLECLERMPVLLIDAKDKTEEYLPKLISTLEKYFGEMKYCQQKTKKSKAVIKYLEKNGVTM